MIVNPALKELADVMRGALSEDYAMLVDMMKEQGVEFPEPPAAEIPNLDWKISREDGEIVWTCETDQIGITILFRSFEETNPGYGQQIGIFSDFGGEPDYKETGPEGSDEMIADLATLQLKAMRRAGWEATHDRSYETLPEDLDF
tara:strand:+ start:646 stop:1080 length:435 start_codon:yes stop_codon:yes gene_type:complete